MYCPKEDETATPQMVKLSKALKALPQPYSKEGFKGQGWSCKSAIVEAKRQFVSICQELLEPKLWQEEIKKVVR